MIWERELHERGGAPGDGLGARNAYGMRIVTAALTTRGLREEEMREIGRIIAAALRPDADEARLDEQAERSRALGGRFPLYPRAAARSAVGG